MAAYQYVMESQQTMCVEIGRLSCKVGTIAWHSLQLT